MRKTSLLPRAHERRSSSRLFILTALGVIAVTATGCYGRARVSWRATVPTHVVVSAAPPPIEAHAVVTPAAAPSQDAVWVEGHYKWEDRWVWVEGHWEANRRGYVWVAPVADESGGQVTYYPGFWCPEGEAPPPVYRRPGRVRVTVRPTTSGGATVSARPPSGGATVTVRPSGGATVTARPSGGATVTARPSGGATVTARPSGRPSGGATVTARPSGQASGGATVTARPSGQTSGRTSGGATVTARPSGQTSGRTSGGATVTARTSGRTSGGVNRGDPTPEQAAPRPRVVAGASGAGATGTAPRPSVSGPTQAGATGRAPSTTSGPTQAGATGRAPGPARSPHVVVNPTPTPTGPRPEVRQPPLTCRIDTPRAPHNGLITVSGSFSTSARVMIGGESAVVVNRGRGELRARVPGSSGGGLVRVIDGTREGSCGTLSISSR